MVRNNKTTFFKTPEDKFRVFQKPRLVMFSGGKVISSWTNTQPAYFYPFSWLDFLGHQGVRELYIYDCSSALAKKEINALSMGKVHFERSNPRLIALAKEREHKVSVICNLEDLSSEDVTSLSDCDFVRVRVSGDYQKLSILEGLPKKRVLSCIKVYAGEISNYLALALKAREMGFDFFHVAKKLAIGSENSIIPKEEKEKIISLQRLETKDFRVVVPSSLEERFARRFMITPSLSNTCSCSFSKYRLVLKGNSLYPCYTQGILSGKGDKREYPKECTDCACIYENDMLFDIETKIKNYKNPGFALEYTEEW